MFSTRLDWSAGTNHLARRLAAHRAAGAELLDLTISNPTRAGFEYPEEPMRAAMAEGARASYSPDPQGLQSAREAVARELSTANDHVDPDDLFLMASTSEAYSYLFKLLADPGDDVLVGRPAYPLLEHLAVLDAVRLRHYSLGLYSALRNDERHARWSLELPEITAAAGERTRAVIVVNPNNPTGNYVSAEEAGNLVEFSAQRSIALISDEVFREYPLHSEERRPSLARADRGLVFALGGLSKLVGLPHYKLGWIRMGGDREHVAAARQGLELISDSYLSLATPVQLALPTLLQHGAMLREQIAARCRENLKVIRAQLAPLKSVEVLSPDGGWSVVVRVPSVESDEELAIELLERAGVIVQPGYFYDFDRDGFLVLSLLVQRDVFEEGVRRLHGAFAERFS